MTKMTMVKVLRAMAIVLCGTINTIWTGIMVTFGCMKMYDIFWNPSNIEVSIGGIELPGILSLFGILALTVCVLTTDRIIKETEEENGVA